MVGPISSPSPAAIRASITQSRRIAQEQNSQKRPPNTQPIRESELFADRKTIQEQENDVTMSRAEFSAQRIQERRNAPRFAQKPTSIPQTSKTSLYRAQRRARIKQKSVEQIALNQISDKTSWFWAGFKTFSLNPLTFILGTLISWFQFFRTILPLDRMMGSSTASTATKTLLPPAFNFTSWRGLYGWFYHALNTLIWIMVFAVIAGLFTLLYYYISLFSSPLGYILNLFSWLL